MEGGLDGDLDGGPHRGRMAYRELEEDRVSTHKATRDLLAEYAGLPVMLVLGPCGAELSARCGVRLLVRFDEFTHRAPQLLAR
jgi:hypothetical protein